MAETRMQTPPASSADDAQTTGGAQLRVYNRVVTFFGHLAVGRSRGGEVLRSVRTVLPSFLLIAVYLVVGVLFYTNMEEKDCEDPTTGDNVFTNCTEPWTAIDAVYFSMVTASTVGYGDFAPSEGNRVFSCVFMLFGIIFVFSAILNLVMTFADTVRSFLDRMNNSLSASLTDPAAPIAIEDIKDPKNPLIYYGSGLVTFGIGGFVIIVLVSSFLYTWIDNKITLGDAVWHCISTATTVGYGDVALTKQSVRLWACIHIVLAVAWLASLIDRYKWLAVKREREFQRNDVLKRQLDADLITSLDQDGNGLDKLEFVVGMLIKLGAELAGSPLTWADVWPFVVQFEHMDADGSGMLTRSDLEEMVTSRHMALQEKRKSVGGRETKQQWGVAPPPSPRGQVPTHGTSQGASSAQAPASSGAARPQCAQERALQGRAGGSGIRREAHGAPSAGDASPALRTAGDGDAPEASEATSSRLPSELDQRDDVMLWL